jgi:hypothetical protein
MSDLQTRQELLACAEQHEQELGRALGDLERAIQRPFQVGQHIEQNINDHPLPWLFAAVLAGVWLGSRVA